jgi:hypothetical protein
MCVYTCDKVVNVGCSLKSWTEFRKSLVCALAEWRSGHRVRLRNKKTRVRIPARNKFIGKHGSAVV